MSDQPNRPEPRQRVDQQEAGFFAEYWIWILVPLVLILCALLYVVFFMRGEDSAFIYNIS